MFDIGFWELVLIFVLAVVVFGPEQLPGLARKLGRFAAKGRAMMSNLQAQLEEEVRLEEIKKQVQAQPPPASTIAAEPKSVAQDDTPKD
jgi:sec-independent protein translocase protein TatB